MWPAILCEGPGWTHLIGNKSQEYSKSQYRAAESSGCKVVGEVDGSWLYRDFPRAGVALCHTAVVAANLHQGAGLILPGVAMALHSGSEASCSPRVMAHQASESQCKQVQSKQNSRNGQN